jgi:phenylacetate-CoA ligase
MDPVLKGVEGILECQFIQTTPSSLEIVFVPDERFREADRLILEGNLRARLGGAMEFHFTPTARIPRGPNGKFRSVVSRLPRHFQPAMEVEEVA